MTNLVKRRKRVINADNSNDTDDVDHGNDVDDRDEMQMVLGKHVASKTGGKS